MKKTLSCESLQGAIYFAPDVLRHCCKRFFINGEMKGDVEIFKVSCTEDITYEKIVKYKKKLYDDINTGKETPCSGCPWLSYDHWQPIDNFKLNHVSIEVHSVCNLRCKYCSETYYGGKQPKYDIQQVIKDFFSMDAISKDVSVVWGGGEATLLNNFEEVFYDITNSLNPKYNRIFTNAVFFSEIIYEYLQNNAVTIITSIDAGTPETFKKIRGANKLKKVLQNLQRYTSAEGSNVIIKYILTEENSSKLELLSFIENIKRYNLIQCTFQISANFKHDGISIQIIDAAFFLYNKLKELDIQLINFDDHLKPRIKKMSSINIRILEPIIIWGAGEYARRLIQTDKFFTENKIKFFVDTNPEKQGKEFCGYPVKPPDEILKDNESKFVIASVLYFKEIYEELINKMGVSPERIIDNPII